MDDVTLEKIRSICFYVNLRSAPFLQLDKTLRTVLEVKAMANQLSQWKTKINCLAM